MHRGSPARAQPAESTAQAGSGARRGMGQLWEHGSYGNRLGWRLRFVPTLRDVTQSQGIVSSSVTGRAGRGPRSKGRELQGEAACPGLDTQRCCVYTGPCVAAPALLCSPSRRFQFLDGKDPLGRQVPSSLDLSASVSRGGSQRLLGACGFLFKNGRRFVSNLAALE